MREFILTYSILLFSWFYSISQNIPIIDSLKIVSKISDSNITKVDLLIEKSFIVRNSNKKKSRDLAIQALSIAKSVNYESGQTKSLLAIGLVEQKEGNFQEAEVLFKEVLSIRERKKDVKATARAYHNLANLYREAGRIDDAEAAYKKTQELLIDYPTSKEMVELLNSRAVLFKDKGQFEEALFFLKRSEKLVIDFGDDLLLANTLLNLGNVYLELDNWEKTEVCYFKSLALYTKMENKKGIGKCLINLGAYHNDYGEFEEAIPYLLDALKYEKNISKLDLANTYNNLGVAVAYQGLGKKYNLEKSYQKALQLYQDLGNERMQALTGNNLGKHHYEEKEFDEAITYLLIADNLISTSESPVTKCNLFYNIYKSYNAKNNDDLAYEYLQKYNELRTTLNRNYLSAVTMERNLEEAENKVTLLELNEVEQKRQNQLLVGGMVILFLIFTAIIGFINAKRNRQKQLIAEYEVEKANQEIDDLLRDQALLTANAKMAGTEETQKRIAKDLHDGLGILLSTIKLYFQEVDKHLIEIKSDLLQKHQKAGELLDKAHEEVRRISHEMISEVLEQFGLVEELKDLIITLNTTHQIDAKFYENGMKERFGVEWEGKVYKIIQELIGNVLKHAKANKITVQLSRIGEEINILVEDNGVGFDPEKVSEKKGVGLRIIASRIDELNGRFHIDSGTGHGTTVSIDVPIPKKLK